MHVTVDSLRWSHKPKGIRLTMRTSVVLPGPSSKGILKERKDDPLSPAERIATIPCLSVS